MHKLHTPCTDAWVKWYLVLHAPTIPYTQEQRNSLPKNNINGDVYAVIQKVSNFINNTDAFKAGNIQYGLKSFSASPMSINFVEISAEAAQ